MPLSIMVKPASGACNMRCRYCFYADEMARRQAAQRGMMTMETFEALCRGAADAGRGDVTIAFQGGEPTLRGLDFFDEATRRAREVMPPDARVSFALQTNGLLVDDAWCDLMLREGVLVGLSLDGPARLHNACRRDAQDAGTCARVMAAADLMLRRRVPFNTLTVVTEQLARDIRRVYTFLMERGLNYQQYILCLDPLGAPRGEYALTPEGCQAFLCTLFDLWYEDVTRGRFVFNRYFENLVGMARGLPPEHCGLCGRCTMQYCVEADGSVYPCDFYCVDEYLLGNVRRDSFAALDEKREQIGFIEHSAQVDAGCADCRWYALCRGGCRRDRDTGSRIGKNRFCTAYAAFFAHAAPRIMELARTANPLNQPTKEQNR